VLKARAWVVAALAACGPARVQQPSAPPPGDQPERETTSVSKAGWTFARQAVVAANPYAAEAGARVLAAGGSAVDAAIAVQAVLTLVEPQSSGIGGGAFLLSWDGEHLEAWDGRETAPAAADPRMFLDASGAPLPFAQAVVGGLSVGVPGVMRMLEAAHAAHGKRPWAPLFEDAVRLADEGFVVSPRLNALLEADPHLRAQPPPPPLYYQADGRAVAIGTLLRNPALAETFRLLARSGAAALHEGPIAQAVVDRVRHHPSNPGRMSAADLSGYRPVKRAAVCADIDAWRICGMPPPSSGGIAVLQILSILSRVPPGLTGASGEVDAMHRTLEAGRLAFADRAQFVADPAFVEPPAGDWGALVAPAYLAARAALVGPRAMTRVEAGVPAGAGHHTTAADPTAAMTGTSHFSIVDTFGGAVSMTTSVEDAFGARTMVRGFLLNNQLTDFSFVPERDGRPVANRVEPGKRPRSSMSPTMVFDRASGRLQMVTGSPGGAPIIHYTARSVWGALWERQPLQAVLDAPNVVTTGGPAILEAGRFGTEALEALRALGHTVEQRPLPSGIHALVRVDGGWQAAADPRREGVASGE
jgi:gamma-glutamyltranspeptidase/glutathione hydrolase